MNAPVEWYRSDPALLPPAVRPSASRRVRSWLRDRLPDPDVRDKTMVVYARQGFRRLSAWAGMFSEFHSVLGALAYAETHGAAGVRVDFRSDLYVDANRGPNWWTYFFTRADMPVRPGPAAGELHLNGVIAKYGRHGGFCDLVNGATPYLYPMTFGIDRQSLHRLLTTHVEVLPSLREDIDRAMGASFEPGAYVVGVHYRGTDSIRGFAGRLGDHRTHRVSYAAYADEVRRALEAASPGRYQVLVATDEVDCLAFMRREFGDRVISAVDVPRVRAGGTAIHFDRTLPVSNFQKGKSGLVDCVLLAATSYLVKGRSNLSDASLAFNPRLPYSFCVR